MDMNKKITITVEDFMKATAEVMASDNLFEIFKSMPHFMMFATAFSTDIAHQLFGEEETTDETNESESEGEN